MPSHSPTASQAQALKSTHGSLDGQDKMIFLLALKVSARSWATRAPCTASVVIGDETIGKKQVSSAQSLEWAFEPPCHIPTDAKIKVVVKAESMISNRISATLSYSELMKVLRAGRTVHEVKSLSGRIIFTFQYALAIPPDAIEIASRRKGVLDRLGKVVIILDCAISIGNSLKEINPLLGVIITSVKTVYQALKQQDTDNRRLLRLITALADTVAYVFDVEQFATLVQLKAVLEEVRNLVRRTTELIIKRDTRSFTGEALSLITSGDKDEIDKLREEFDCVKTRFDRGMIAETFVSLKSTSAQLDQMRTKLEALATSQEDNQYLSKLEPRQTVGRRCLHGTRVDILSTIHTWANDFTQTNILWIRGYPGAGKSTIASHVAHDFKSSGQFGALFMFDRKLRTSLLSLWRTLAYFLAAEYPICRTSIVDSLKAHVLDNATADDIFKRLIVEPLRLLNRDIENIPAARLPVIVVDALDECCTIEGASFSEDSNLLSHLVLWAKHFHSAFPSLKLIVTSRDESDIRHSFLQSIPHILLDIPVGKASHSAATDIHRYFVHEFAAITARNNALPSNWPGSEVISLLVERSAGIFIWATTVARYIAGVGPEERLQHIMDLQLPPGGIHALYRDLLNSSFPAKDATTSQIFRAVVGPMVVAQTPLSPKDWTTLLPEVKLSTFNSVVDKLGPVVDSDDVTYFIHQSFVDFLLGSDSKTFNGDSEEFSCPERFRINAASEHARITYSSLSLINNSASPLPLCDIHVALVDPLGSEYFSRTIARHLRYSCMYWGEHLSNLRGAQEGGSFALSSGLTKEITILMKTNVVFWLAITTGCGGFHLIGPALDSLKWRIQTSSAADLIGINTQLSEIFAFFVYIQDASALSVPLLPSLPDVSRQPTSLAFLGSILQRRYRDFRLSGDADRAIQAVRCALEVVADDTFSKSHFYSILSSIFCMRFELGRRVSVDDLNQAVNWAQKAVTLAPNASYDKSKHLTTLSHIHLVRFERMGTVDDLQESIVIGRDALDLMAPDDPLRRRSIDRLNRAVYQRFSQFGDLTDIGEVIASNREALTIVSDDDPSRPRYLDKLGDALRRQFEHTGRIEDIQEAATACKESVKLTPIGHPSRPEHLDHLGGALLLRFLRLRAQEDIDEAVAVRTQAVEDEPDDHPDKAARLTNLGLTLQTRFIFLRHADDAAVAVKFCRTSVALTPDGHPAKPLRLDNLRGALIRRWIHAKALEDLEEAIVVGRQAVELTAVGHPDKAKWLNNFAITLQHRYFHTRSRPDLDEAITLARQSVELIPTGDARRSTFSKALGIALKNRFTQFHDIADIDDAIDILREATALMPDDDREKQASIKSLESAIRIRAEYLNRTKSSIR